MADDSRGVITRLEKKREHVCHDSFHIMDPVFGLQVILNGHEYVAVAAQGEGIGFTKEGNCLLRSRIRSAWPGSQMPGRVMRL